MRLLIFDLDGTLVDSRESILKSIDHALQRVGLDHFEVDREKAVQQDLVTTIKQAAAGGGYGISEPLIQQFVSEYRVHHSTEPEKSIRPFVSIREVLEELSKEFDLAVATTKHSTQAAHILERLSLAHFFDHIQGTDPGMRYKPAPDILYAVMNKLGYEPHESLYVGDSVHDMAAAKAAGVKAVAVSYGFSRPEELIASDPHFVIHSPDEIRNPLRFFQ